MKQWQLEELCPGTVITAQGARILGGMQHVILASFIANDNSRLEGLVSSIGAQGTAAHAFYNDLFRDLQAKDSHAQRMLRLEVVGHDYVPGIGEKVPVFAGSYLPELGAPLAAPHESRSFESEVRNPDDFVRKFGNLFAGEMGLKATTHSRNVTVFPDPSKPSLRVSGLVIPAYNETGLSNILRYDPCLRHQDFRPLPDHREHEFMRQETQIQSGLMETYAPGQMLRLRFNGFADIFVISTGKMRNTALFSPIIDYRADDTFFHEGKLAAAPVTYLEEDGYRHDQATSPLWRISVSSPVARCCEDRSLARAPRA